MLGQEDFIDDGASYDFNRWYCSLLEKKKIYDKMKEECVGMKNYLGKI